MSFNILPQDQVFWYLDRNDVEPLHQSISVDVAVVGGGMAGLSAAQSFMAKGTSVALLEKNYCGSGASGKSSGFITPDSEISLSDFINSYGDAEAKPLWDFVISGVKLIESNILKFDLKCDYQVQDSLVVASTKSDFKEIEEEYKVRSKLGYGGTLWSAEELSSILGTKSYHGGVSYGETFGIRAYQYCQEIKQVLKNQGVKIYEETPVLEISGNEVKTPQGTVKAKYIILCTDHFTPYLKRLKYEIYHAQTFLAISNPLTESEIKTIFPDKKYMIWDTDLIYQYFRVTGDNRLMLGGASLLYTYAKNEKHNNNWMINKINKYYKSKFTKHLARFEYIWPGLIGISKDLMPIAGRDKTEPHIYYVCAAAGLPWAAALGYYSAENLISNETNLDKYFSPYRKFKIGPTIQSIIGTKLSFALSNFMQVGSL